MSFSYSGRRNLVQCQISIASSASNVSFNNWGGLSSLTGFDDFFGVNNFDGSRNDKVVIVEQQQVCHVQQVTIIQQQLAIIQEVTKQWVSRIVRIMECRTKSPLIGSSLNRFAMLRRRSSSSNSSEEACGISGVIWGANPVIMLASTPILHSSLYSCSIKMVPSTTKTSASKVPTSERTWGFQVETTGMTQSLLNRSMTSSKLLETPETAVFLNPPRTAPCPPLRY